MYEPTLIPTEDTLELSQAVQTELAKIGEVLSTYTEIPIPQMHVEPAKPHEGMLRYSDGADWDPVGTGVPTFVAYTGGAWRNLQFGGSGGVDSVFGRTGDVVAVQADYDSFFLTQAEGDALYEPLLGFTPADDSLVVHLAGTETITGAKTLDGDVTFELTDGAGLTKWRRNDTGAQFNLNLAGNDWRISNASGAGSDFLFGVDAASVDQGNRVGIGVAVPSERLDIAGSIALTGTVDGRDIDADGTKLDGIESSATADQTAAEIEAIVDHDNLLGFLAAEHIDWSVTGVEDIHADRFANSPAEVNDLTAAVIWANVPNANITQGSVTQHEAALSIQESQIVDAGIFARVASAEAISGNWTITGQWIFQQQLDIQRSGGAAQDFFNFRDTTDAVDLAFHYDGANFEIRSESLGFGNLYMQFTEATGAVAFGGAADFVGAVTALSYGGITEANLLDKLAAETISGDWTFDINSNVRFDQVVDFDAGGLNTRWTSADSTKSCQFSMGNDSVLRWESASTIIVEMDGPRLLTDASTAARAGFNIPEGIAPTSPVDGDMWVTTTDIFARINGVSESLLGSAEINDLTAAVVWANVPNANVTVGSVTQHVASIDHDLLLNSLAAEHVDWAVTGAENLHVDRYVAADIEGIVDHDNLIGFVGNEHIDWTSATQNVTTTGVVKASELRLSRTGGIAVLQTDTAVNDPQFLRFDESVANTGIVWLAVSDDFDVKSANDIFYVGDSNLVDWRFRIRGDGTGHFNSGAAGSPVSERIFADDYHPNADVWTVGRTITLTGDVTGVSAAFDGSANLSFATVVVEANVDHDALNNFVAAEHIDWAVTGAEDIHVDRIIAGAVTQHEAALSVLESQIPNANIFPRVASAEVITGAWTFDHTAGVLHKPTAGQAQFRLEGFGSAKAGQLLHTTAGDLILRGDSTDATDDLIWTSGGGWAFEKTLDIIGALTALSYGGITETNLLDKTAAETGITGNWTITGDWIFDISSNVHFDQVADFDGGINVRMTSPDSTKDIQFNMANDSVCRVESASTIIMEMDGPRLLTDASTSARAGFNIPEGAAPSSPVDGDMWVTATDILARINGVSESLIGAGAPSSGAWTYVSTTTISAATSVEFKDLTESAYMLVLENIIPALNNDFFRMRVSDDNGVTYEIIDYQFAMSDIKPTASETIAASSSFVSIPLITGIGVGNGAGEFGLSGIIRLHAVNLVGSPMTVTWHLGHMDGTSGKLHSTRGSGVSADDGNGGSTTDVDAIELFFFTGNITSGTVHLYKLVTS